jgi:hypothetical protein
MCTPWFHKLCVMIPHDLQGTQNLLKIQLYPYTIISKYVRFNEMLLE